MCSPLGRALLSQAEKSGSFAGGDATYPYAYSGKRYAPGGEGAEANERSAKSQRTDRDQPPPAPAVFKFLAPETLANALEAFAAIIGEAAGGELELTPSSDPFPGTSSRTACVIADNKDGIMEGMKKVLNIVTQCGECVSTRPGEFQFTCLMPAKSCAMLIGVKGQNIKDLVKTSGAHVHVEGQSVGFDQGSGPGGDKLVQVRGPYVGLENALHRLVECTLEFQDQPWFPEWVVRTNSDRKLDEADLQAKKSDAAGSIGPAPQAAAAVPDSGAPAGNAEMMPDMAAMAANMAGMASMANMCSMMMGMGGMGGMMPMMGMGGMGGMMPFFGGMNPMCMPMMMGCGMPGMMALPGADGMGATNDTADATTSASTRAQGASPTGSPSGAFAKSVPTPPRRIPPVVGGPVKPLKVGELNKIPAGIMARSSKGTLRVAGKPFPTTGEPFVPPPPPGKPKEFAPQDMMAPPAQPMAEYWQSPAEWVAGIPSAGAESSTGAEPTEERAEEPAPEKAEKAENPPDFDVDEDNLTEEQLAQRIDQQRKEIERLRWGLSFKTKIPAHRRFA